MSHIRGWPRPGARLALPAAVALACLLVVDARADQSAPDIAEAYCRGIRDEAIDARYRLQSERLAEMATKLEKKTSELEAQIKAYRDWYALRREFTARATDKLVRIFANMRSEAAADQLTRMPLEVAAALVLKFETEVASAVLNEMKPDHAARLAGLISDAAGEPLQEAKP